MAQRVIFHVDANSAFLSWTAVYRLKVLGEKEDLREVPSVIAGDKESRHSIILAKSVPAKKFGIQTGEPLFQALEKCPGLRIEAPDYALYVEASRHFVQVLRQFSPYVEQYSIDEAWVDMTGTERLWGSPRLAAEQMRKRIWDELGFTVNVGISSNKLLAKMAGDLEKPNKVHTLFPEEMESKMWPLPVRDLFLVGPATERKLKLYGIYTIGDLAKAVQLEVEVQLERLPRRDIARASVDQNGMIIVAEDLSLGIEIANRLAPEHLELMVDDPFAYLDSIRNAGSVFLGRSCPEALGDYFAGPNHTLPTSGTARFSSPLSVDDFVKKSQFTYYTADALAKVADDVAYFARQEGLTAHAKSAVIRKEEPV